MKILEEGVRKVREGTAHQLPPEKASSALLLPLLGGDTRGGCASGARRHCPTASSPARGRSRLILGAAPGGCGGSPKCCRGGPLGAQAPQTEGEGRTRWH